MWLGRGGSVAGSVRGVIVGIGIDVVDVARFGQSLERSPGLRDRLFTVDERDLPLASLAARFAAKEALAKALGAPAGLHWHDCRVVKDDDGRPSLDAHRHRGRAGQRCSARTAWHLTLSHDAGIASAMVVGES